MAEQASRSGCTNKCCSCGDIDGGPDAPAGGWLVIATMLAFLLPLALAVVGAVVGSGSGAVGQVVGAGIGLVAGVVLAVAGVALAGRAGKLKGPGGEGMASCPGASENQQ